MRESRPEEALRADLVRVRGRERGHRAHHQQPEEALARLGLGLGLGVGEGVGVGVGVGILNYLVEGSNP